MGSLKLNLKDKKAKHQTAIVALYRHNGQTHKYYFGQSISPAKWDFERQRVKSSHPHANRINRLLAKIEQQAVSIHLDAMDDGIPLTSDLLRERLDEALGRAKNDNQSLIAFIDKFIEERKKDKRYKTGSIKVYKTTRNHLNRYNPKLTFSDITLEFFYDFVEYLYNKEFAQNYVQKVVSTLKTFLNDATDRRLNNNLAYKSRKFSVPRQRTQKIYLSEEELEQLYKAKLSGPEEKARDLFMISAFTGLRYSDLHNLKEPNFQTYEGTPILRIKMIKTGDEVVIRRHPIVDQIWNKYGGNMPEMSNQKMNEYLKLAAKSAKITQKVIMSINKGGERQDEVREKWELVTTHTGRRSMICNLYKAGIQSETIMRISGHRSHKSFMDYLKLSPEDHLKRIEKNQFFKEAGRYLKVV